MAHFNTEPLRAAAVDYAEARDLKRIVNKQLGEKCEEYNDDCMTCRAHKIADFLLESAADSLASYLYTEGED